MSGACIKAKTSGTQVYTSKTRPRTEGNKKRSKVNHILQLSLLEVKCVRDKLTKNEHSNRLSLIYLLNLFTF